MSSLGLGLGLGDLGLGLGLGLGGSPCAGNQGDFPGVAPCVTGRPVPGSSSLSSTIDRTIVSWNSGITGLSSGNTTGFFGDGNVNSTNLYTRAMPYVGTAKNLTVSLRNNTTGNLFTLGAGQSITVVVYKLTNIGLTTPGLQVTLTFNQSTVSSGANPFTVNRGDLLSVKVTSSTGLTDSPTIGITASVEVDSK